MEFLMGSGKRFFEFATKLAELMWVNVLTILCSIPVITAGCAITSMHHVLLAIYRDEEKKITGMYFKAFRDNFGQATKLWLVYLGYFAFLGLDYWAMRMLENENLRYLELLLPVLTFLGLLSMSWTFVMQFRYSLSLKETLLFSVTRIVAFPIRTLGMGVAAATPLLLTVFLPQFFILVPLLGLSVPGLISVCFYNGALKVMEEAQEEDLDGQV